jgi:hypothetical protein
MALTPGEIRRTAGDLTVRVVNGADPLGNISVMVLNAAGEDEYLTIVPVGDLIPDIPTYRATTPYGFVTVECPADGARRQRALWSQAAVDAYLAENPPPPAP